MSKSRFLRRILGLDAFSCLGMGALLAVGASALAAPFGLGVLLLRGAGLALLPLGLFIGWLAGREPPTPLVWIVILGNLAWSAESLVVVAQSQGAITPLGTAFVTMQALFVAVMAALEYRGLKLIARSKAVASPPQI